MGAGQREFISGKYELSSSMFREALEVSEAKRTSFLGIVFPPPHAPFWTVSSDESRKMATYGFIH